MSWPAAAEQWAPDHDTCNQQPNTIAIVDCIDARTRFWDGRLNQAYKAVVGLFQSPELKNRLAPLQAAQREWLKFRDLDCLGYYGSQQGTIRQIEVATCMRELTQSRAIELQGEGPQ
jgi:uncharacterized protein YecT (DUF1311 family)